MDEIKKDFLLTDEDLEFYKENGYLVFHGFFSVMQCDWMFDIFIRNSHESFRALMNIERDVPAIAHYIINDSRLVSILEQIHNSKMCYLGTQVLFKKVGTRFAKHAWRSHQDNAYIEAPYGTYVSAIIALEDSDPENGGMYLYEGSHVEPILPYTKYPSHDPDSDPGYEVVVPVKYLSREIDLWLKKGSLYIQHGHLIHGSYPNNSSSRSRPHFGIMCLVEGMPFNAGSQPRVAASLKRSE